MCQKAKVMKEELEIFVNHFSVLTRDDFNILILEKYFLFMTTYWVHNKEKYSDVIGKIFTRKTIHTGCWTNELFFESSKLTRKFSFVKHQTVRYKI